MSTQSSPLAVVVLAGGQGTRLTLGLPKVLAPLCGAASVDYVLEAAQALSPTRTVVVVCHEKDKVQSHLRGASVEFVDQVEALGTGHAVASTRALLESHQGDVLVLFGDGPLVRGETLVELVARHQESDAACTLLSAHLDDPTGYGRILRQADGSLERVVEEKDASASERAVQEVHCGLAVFRGPPLFQVLTQLPSTNAQGEYYLTDAYQLLQQGGGRVEVQALTDSHEGMGFNTPEDLLEVRRILRRRILAGHQANGVQVEDPDTAFIDRQVTIGAGTRILPFTVIRGPVSIGRNCEIGPFTHLRAGVTLDDGAQVGNFVEMKNSRLGAGAKAKHLTYLGDTQVGERANIGAGTITANYDGRAKHATEIGPDAFIGSGAILVAPAHIGDGAVVGAGAVVTRGHPVPPGSTVVGVPARPLNHSHPSTEDHPTEEPEQ